MDFADHGSASFEEANNAAVSAARAAAAQSKPLLVTGFCRNLACGEDVVGRPFCNAKCRDEYDQMKKRGNQ